MAEKTQSQWKEWKFNYFTHLKFNIGRQNRKYPPFSSSSSYLYDNSIPSASPSSFVSLWLLPRYSASLPFALYQPFYPFFLSHPFSYHVHADHEPDPEKMFKGWRFLDDSTDNIFATINHTMNASICPKLEVSLTVLVKTEPWQVQADPSHQFLIHFWRGIVVLQTFYSQYSL